MLILVFDACAIFAVTLAVECLLCFALSSAQSVTLCISIQIKSNSFADRNTDIDKRLKTKKNKLLAGPEGRINCCSVDPNIKHIFIYFWLMMMTCYRTSVQRR